MIVDSNSAAPLQYVDPTYQSSLFVRSKIYDLSGVSPSLESSVNLTLIDNGVYRSKYTYTAGKPYLVQTLVYTDGTYTLVDTTYAQSVDEVQCIDLKTANLSNLDASVSSRNSTAHFDAVIGTPAGASIAADLVEIEGETDGIAAIPTTPLLSADTRLNHLDADISSRLATIGYTAPDNADIVAIKAKTDNLPADPASNTQVATRVATTHFDTVIGSPAGASIAADIAEVEAETDGISAIPTNPLLASSYTAPNNAGIAAIEAKTNNLPVDPASESLIEAAVNVVLTAVAAKVSTTHFDSVIGTPAGASIAADIAEIEGETDNIASIKAVTDQFTFTGSNVNATSSGSAATSVPDIGVVSVNIQNEDQPVAVNVQEEDELVQVTIVLEDIEA